jgi:hypothetical protein
MSSRLTIQAVALAVAVSSAAAGGFGKLPVSARAVTFGGSLIAVQDDPNALFSNPAAIASLTSLSLSTSYTNLFPGITGDQLSYLSGSAVADLGLIGNVGLGIKAFRSNAWKEGELVGTYAQSLFDIVTVGGSVKLLYWSSAAPAGRLAVPEDGLSKTTLSFDAGVQARFADILPENDIIVAASVQDLTRPSIASNGSADGKLDLTASFGVAYISRALEYIVHAYYLSAGDLNRMAIGVEIVAARGTVIGQEASFTVRLGGNSAFQPAQQGDLFGGVGAELAAFRLDYAYGQPTRLDHVGGTHHVTLRTSF